MKGATKGKDSNSIPKILISHKIPKNLILLEAI